MIIKSLKEREKIIVKKFRIFQNWEEKYEYLIELGKKLKKKPNIRSNNKLIYGCQSKVWIDSTFDKGRIFFKADSDALLPKGLVSIMIYIYSGLPPYEIISSNYHFISKIGFQNFLSPIRANGIILFIKRIKLYAFYFDKKYLRLIKHNIIKNK
ncbi:SufE family protein [Blattabacterium cuenoti]|uniref:SufE family protein n=1 Tax=Blattabacterium cuenoti TaxID=1653831 RepID=UPI00163C034A|nr:SufE family protein [Blattabacterium cuenoti]